MKSFRSLLAFAVFVAAIVGIIYPAFIEGPNGAHPSFSQILVSIVISPQWTLGYAMRVLCVFIVLAGSYIFVIGRMYKATPITIVNTSIEVEFNSDYSIAKVKRRQVLKANQPDVTAYFTTLSPTSQGGKVPKSSITMSTYCHGANLNCRFDHTGSEDKGFEIIHHFGRQLPYQWFMPLIPTWALQKPLNQHPPFIRKNLVSRSQASEYHNEFNMEQPMINLVAANYPQHNIIVDLKFPNGKPNLINAFRIKSNGVVQVQFEDLGSGDIRVHVDRLQGETLRISWKN